MSTPAPRAEHAPPLHVLVLEHADWETPGLYSEVLAERRARVTAVRPDRGDRMPAARDFDAVLAMGGPMSVNDEPRLLWLADEKRLIAGAVRAGTPFFGVCLGAQLLASSLGARIYPGKRPEYGVHPVRLTPEAAADPVFGGLPPEPPVFQWHGETFDLPAGAVPLATSALYRHQAFRVGKHAYGVQYHSEVSIDLLAKWLAIPSCRDELCDRLGPNAAELIATHLAIQEQEVLAHGRQIFSRWLDLAARPARATAEANVPTG